MVDHVDRLGDADAGTLADRYRTLTAPARDALVSARTAATATVEATAQRLDELRVERNRVARETDAGPEPPPWRSTSRDGRTGAPLWACCDFADTLDDPSRAALEAALHAAGLLDAWVSPPGAGLDAHDSWLVADRPATKEPERATLRSALVATPPPDAGLDSGAVDAVLDSVALGQLGIAVDTEGRFRLGPLAGRAAKPEADYIGATARSARRARRLASLDMDMVDIAQILDAAETEVDRLTGELTRLDAAPDTLPTAQALLAALAAASIAAADARATAAGADRARRREADAAARLTAAERSLRDIAASRRLPTDPDGIDRVEQSVAAFARTATTAAEERRRAETDARTAASRRTRADELAERLAVRRRELTAADEEAIELHTRARTLRTQLGPDAEAPLVALARCDQRLQDLRRERDRLDDQRADLTRQEGETDSVLRVAADDAEHAALAVTRTGSHLGVLRRRDVRAVVDPDGVDADLPTDPVEAAAALASALPDAPADEAHTRHVAALDRAQKALLDDLHHGYDPAIAHDDGLTIIEIVGDRGAFGVDHLARMLRDQELELQTFLTEGDREVFERFLLNRVAHELRTLLSDADEFVAHVNKALGDAPTASGLRVELGWEFAEDDRSMRDAVELLRHDTNQLGEPERARLRSFFERIIREQRADRPAEGYKVALAAALDYRSWYRFQPYLRGADGGRTRLTQKRFRELSGGEQAVTLHLPLFAAAAAHYDGAGTRAPRLVALDEAFAGIDEAMRGELMGLTVRFDLDVIMTGHELWGAYSEVPAVAVHDLLRRPPAEGVNVLSMRWDGHALVEEAALGTTASAEGTLDLGESDD